MVSSCPLNVNIKAKLLNQWGKGHTQKQNLKLYIDFWFCYIKELNCLN